MLEVSDCEAALGARARRMASESETETEIADEDDITIHDECEDQDEIHQDDLNYDGLTDDIKVCTAALDNAYNIDQGASDKKRLNDATICEIDETDAEKDPEDSCDETRVSKI